MLVLHNGEVLANNSDVPLNAIGEDGKAILCISDLPANFYYPDDTPITNESGGEFYITRGNQILRLNYNSPNSSTNEETPLGYYCCEVENSDTEAFCINIV